MLFNGKVPIAFDFGAYNYEPWRTDYKNKFNEDPKNIGHDDIRIFYPQRKYLSESIKNGEIPFWNPYEFIGNPTIANSQYAAFYPPFLLFLIFPINLAWSILSFSIPIVAGIGTYLFLKKLIGNGIPAVFGALVFAFSSAIIVRTQDGLVAGHSLIWLPWIFFAVESYFRKRDIKSLILVSTIVFFSILAGWFQFSFYVIVMGITYSGIKSLSLKNRKDGIFSFVLLTAIFIISILLTSFHWFPALEALSVSPRGVLGVPKEFKTNHLMPAIHLFTLLVPNLFGHISSGTYFGASEFKEGVIAIGTIPFLLTILAALKKNKKSYLFFFITFILTSVLGSKNIISTSIINIKFPILSTFLPNRIFVISTFTLAILSAVGMKSLIEGKGKIFKKILITTLGLFSLFYLSIISIYGYEKLLAKYTDVSLFKRGFERFIRISVKESIIPFIFVAIIFFILVRSKSKINKILISSLIFITLLGQMLQANRYLYFSEAKHQFPENPVFSFLQEKTKDNLSRVIGVSFDSVPANVPMYYELYFPEGVDAMYPVWYGEFAQKFNSEKPTVDGLSRIEVAYSKTLTQSDKRHKTRWKDPATINLLAHLGIKYLIIPEGHGDKPPEGIFEKVFSYKWHTIYEYKYAFPKAYFVPKAVLSNQRNLTLHRIFLPAFFSNKEVIIALEKESTDFQLSDIDKQLSDNKDLVAMRKKSSGAYELDPYHGIKQALSAINENPVSIINYSANNIELKSNSKEDGFIVINDSYFPGWQAKVDDNSAALLRANHAFRAIPVSKGTHTIRLKFVPRSFYQGLTISFITVFLSLIGYTLFRYRKSKKK